MLHPLRVRAFPLGLVLLVAMAEVRSEGSPDSRPSASLADLLPAGIDGYAPREPDGFYGADTLFELIDGGAEVYRSFGVRSVVSRRYGKTGAPDILADLFDMGTAGGAYGAYNHDIRDGRQAGLGRESELSGGALAFWKDRFFLSLVAFDESEETERVLRAMGRVIDAAIPRRGEIPEVVRLLPADGPPPTRTSYFRDGAYLNTRYPLADADLLNLGADADGVLARYPGGAGSVAAGGSSYVLMLVRYPDPPRAAKALERLQEAYLPRLSADGTASRPGGGWTGARTSGRNLVVVLESEKKPDLNRLVRPPEERKGK